MIRSMTAFARHQVSGPWGQATWEIRTVNHRFCEMSFRLPDLFKEKEAILRKLSQTALQRGKMDCTLRYIPSGGEAQALVPNWPFIEQFIQVCKLTESRLENPSPLKATDILNRPEALLASYELDPEIWSAVEQGFEKTLTLLVESRVQEGAALKAFILEKLASCQSLQHSILDRRPIVLNMVRERLLSHLKELEGGLNVDRLEQEMVLLVQRIDIQEELERLQTHLLETERSLQKGQAVGRRLDFLMQELHRETNTLGTKSADAEIAQAAVSLKVLIEQMREQIQNVE